VVQVSRSRWRWLALAHPALTLLAVVVTANHFWLDGLVAALILALVLLVQRAVRVAGRRRQARRRAAATEPAGSGDHAERPEPAYVPDRPPVDA
jgi:PAP2 superfamily